MGLIRSSLQVIASPPHPAHLAHRPSYLEVCLYPHLLSWPTPQASPECRPCPTGWYAPTVGTGNCLPCPAGSYSLRGAGHCLGCPRGWITPVNGTGHCSQCLGGKYANLNINGTACLSCPAGTFSYNGELAALNRDCRMGRGGIDLLCALDGCVSSVGCENSWLLMNL